MEIRYRVVGKNQDELKQKANQQAREFFTSTRDWRIRSIEARPLLRKVSDWSVVTWEADVEACTL